MSRHKAGRASALFARRIRPTTRDNPHPLPSPDLASPNHRTRTGNPPTIQPRPIEPPAASPEAALRAWPAESPLACLWSGGTPGRWSRWTILAAPTETLAAHNLDAALAPIAQSASIATAESHASNPDHPPFAGGVIGSLSYDLGGALEPAARSRDTTPTIDHAWPLATWLVCPGAYAHDAITGQWWIVGDRAALPTLNAPAHPIAPQPFTAAPMQSDTGRSAYIDRVARTIELIRAGDIFQANIAHRLSGAFAGSTRAAFLALVRSANPWFGAYLETPSHDECRRTIMSLSPELFLDFDPRTRRIITRPMKGTLPASLDPAQLEHSNKDAAELAMIVDLMRNDLGRVAAFGSVRVDQRRVIERHAATESNTNSGVYQGVATVTATLRPGLTTTDLLRATFPGGSITGAPKIRAMQIIDELEQSPRGPAFGAIGYASTCGRLSLNIAIRTALVSGIGPRNRPGTIDQGTLDYTVGAGIVADSVPEHEWRETLDKARILGAIASIPKVDERTHEPEPSCTRASQGIP